MGKMGKLDGKAAFITGAGAGIARVASGRRVRHAGLCGPILLACVGHAFAQGFPTRPIRILEPYAAGGSSDVIARLIAPKVGLLLGQPVLVENIPGASGTVAAGEVARSTDGHTLLMGVSSTVSVIPSLRHDLPYNSSRDLVPVAELATFVSVLVVPNVSKIKNIKELIALAKSEPGRLNYSSGGVGTANHLCAELFKSMAGLSITHVPYKGGAPAVTAVMAGQVDMMFATLPGGIGPIRSGLLRALATTGPRRSVYLPDIPTVDEAGLPGFEVVTWSGIMGPSTLAKTSIAKLNAAFNTAMNDPEAKASVAAQASDVATGTPTQFGEVIRKDTDTWARLIQSASIKGE